MRARAFVCVRACVRVCACVCVRACVCVCVSLSPFFVREGAKAECLPSPIKAKKKKKGEVQFTDGMVHDLA